MRINCIEDTSVIVIIMVVYPEGVSSIKCITIEYPPISNDKTRPTIPSPKPNLRGSFENDVLCPFCLLSVA